MTTSNVMADSEAQGEATAPVEISPARRLYWSVRRELWENRSIYLAPLAVAGVFLIGFAISLIGLPDRVRAAAALGAMEQRAAIEQPYLIVALMLMGIALLVAVIYCLDALYGERRDRSILFWKSLPVSDGTTVLAVNAKHVVHSGDSGNNGGYHTNPVLLEGPPNEISW